MTLPPWLHIVLVAAFTIYFIVKFIKDRYLYEFIFILWAPSTLLTYVITDKTMLLVLGIVQILLFILTFFLMFKRRGTNLRATYKMLAEFDSTHPDKNESDSQESTLIENKDDSNKESK